MGKFRCYYFVAVFLAGAFACFAWAVSSWSVGMAQAESPQGTTIPKITALKLQPDSLVLAHKRDVRRVLVSGRTEEGYWMTFPKQQVSRRLPQPYKLTVRDTYIQSRLEQQKLLSRSAEKA